MAKKTHKYPPLRPEAEFEDCVDCYRLQADFEKVGAEPRSFFRVGGFSVRQMGHLLYHSPEGRVRLCQAARRPPRPHVNKQYQVITIPENRSAIITAGDERVLLETFDECTAKLLKESTNDE